jgi:CheY-like chemotaxis protein
MDGIEATARFRTFEREKMEEEETIGCKRLLIVGMSANSDNQTKQEALNAGIDYFVAKVCISFPIMTTLVIFIYPSFFLDLIQLLVTKVWI